MRHIDAIRLIENRSQYQPIMSQQPSPADARGANRNRRFVLSHSGDDYRVDVLVPAGEPPAAGWPAMVMLDAEGCFMTAAEALARMSRRPDATSVQPMVLIGLSTPGRDPLLRRRERDFGPRGAASPFADFVEREVIPPVVDGTPVDRRRLTLCGHSLGGYFALWMLAHRPHLFARIAAISPSIWWSPDELRGALMGIPQGRHRVLICTGEWEEDLPPWQAARPDHAAVRARRADRRMVARAREIGDLLAGHLGDDAVLFRLLAEEDHASILSAAVPRALRLASSPLE